MCGIGGVITNGNAAPDLYRLVQKLQHRGPNAAGLLTLDAQLLPHILRGIGEISDMHCQRMLHCLFPEALE